MNDERVDPPVVAEERAMLRAWLDWHRSTLAFRCQGLTEDQLRRQSMPPSTLSLLGLVRHLAEVERTWFRRVIAGEDIPLVWSDRFDFQEAYDATTADMGEAFAYWEAEVTAARVVEGAAESLDVTGYQDKWDEWVSLRWVFMQMIHEYARHNGHADFLREGVDGQTGA